jgi:hypothetical protein
MWLPVRPRLFIAVTEAGEAMLLPKTIQLVLLTFILLSIKAF